ncbi:MAG: hypothetical protein E6J90_36810 [Deltaproteobacteria bacterium]|nr:MAG: hypothetical protein E6J91_38965 [Deltaproteobacteria bacterium]TMQ10096.1 MAG: hypothetical protein E6J90_36810 [Deltaproteobacteria bacterium]
MGAQVIHEALRALHARGRETWPQIAFDFAAFSAMAASRLGEGPFNDIRAGDLYLATACAARIEPALAAIDKHYLSGLASALVRRGHDAATAADAVQALRVRFLVGEASRAPRIAEYDGRRSLATWIKVATVRIALSARRKHRRETVDEVELIAAARSPELDLLCRRFGAEFEAAFRSTFEALSPRERTLLRYQVIDRLGIDRIAAIYGVHQSSTRLPTADLLSGTWRHAA